MIGNLNGNRVRLWTAKIPAIRQSSRSRSCPRSRAALGTRGNTYPAGGVDTNSLLMRLQNRSGPWWKWPLPHTWPIPKTGATLQKKATILEGRDAKDKNPNGPPADEPPVVLRSEGHPISIRAGSE